MSQRKNIFVVLSPPRCGSSCIAHALQALGVNLGTDLMAPDVTNPKGFFEDNALNEINRTLLERLKSFQNGEGPFNPLKSDMFQSACDLLENRFKSCSNYGFKDPRTIRFLPFWQEVFKTLNLHDSYAIAIRNPLSAAHSMNQIGSDRALFAWLAHLLPACQLTKNKKRVVVDYDEMLDSPHKQFERISNALDLSHSKNESELKIYCDEFLDKSLNHHKYTFEQCKSHPGIFPLCITVYSCLLKFARDEIDFQKKDYQIEWEAVEDYCKQYIPLYSYTESLLTKNENSKKQLKKSQDLCTQYEEQLKKSQNLCAQYEEQLKKSQDRCAQYEKSLLWRITRPLQNVKKLFIDQPKI